MIGFRLTWLPDEQMKKPWLIPLGTPLVSHKHMGPWGSCVSEVIGYGFQPIVSWAPNGHRSSLGYFVLRDQEGIDRKRMQVGIMTDQKDLPFYIKYVPIGNDRSITEDQIPWGTFSCINWGVKVVTYNTNGTISKPKFAFPHCRKVPNCSVQEYVETRKKRTQEIAKLTPEEVDEAIEFGSNIARELFRAFFPKILMENMNLMYLWSRVKWLKTYRKLSDLQTDAYEEYFDGLSYWSKGSTLANIGETEESWEQRRKDFDRIRRAGTLARARKAGVRITSKVRKYLILKSVGNKRRKIMLEIASTWSKDAWDAIAERAAEYCSERCPSKEYALMRLISRACRSEYRMTQEEGYGRY